MVQLRLKQNAQSEQTGSTAGSSGQAGKAGQVLVDLVVVIATHETMEAVAAEVSAALEKAGQIVAGQGAPQARIVWFGIEGIWPETQFNQSYRTYLQAQQISETQMIIGQPGRMKTGQAQKDGAAAIMDIAHHFDWRSGANRAIFYLSDAALKGSYPPTRADVRAANNAIKIARNEQVKLFTYAGASPDTIGGGTDEIVQAEYERLATETDGRFYTGSPDNLRGFATILAEILCLSAAGGDKLVKIPEIGPDFVLRWGDGPRDQLETTDLETLYLVARNPYPNVILKDVTIIRSTITDAQGKRVPELPDGTPSVIITPAEMIHFGDIPPSSPQVANDSSQPVQLSEIARAFTLTSQSARQDNYLLDIHYSHEVEFAQQGTCRTPLTLAPNWWRRLFFILLPLLLLFPCLFCFWIWWPSLVADPGDLYHVDEMETLELNARGSRGVGINTYTWDFGDGSTGQGITVTHVYTDGPAQYVVTLTITDSLRRVRSETAQVLVYNVPPTTEIKADYACLVKQTIPLSGTCGDPSPADRQSLTCTWADLLGAVNNTEVISPVIFSDNSNSETAHTNQMIAGQPSYTCPAHSGRVSVTLTATDKDGASHEDIAIIRINHPPTVAIAVNDIPKTSVGYFFDGRGSNDPDGEIIYYKWNFGDGSVLTQTTTHTHTYLAPGIYTVTLTVTDNLSATATTAITLPISDN